MLISVTEKAWAVAITVWAAPQKISFLLGDQPVVMALSQAMNNATTVTHVTAMGAAQIAGLP
jgi:hypothetical protein